MATRRTTTKTPTTTAPAPVEPALCQPCGGTGNVAITVRVGRKRRPVGQQDGLCLNCLGTGTNPDA
ncbi:MULTISPECIES: hypothetical protein [Streptomyces]|uniref:Molecular chaperone DnaJ n=1 Tax=Streptomyces griseus subsp. griseus (strain JCM 4626 / CBS 651.72 / NBRC 13350 / KCC S-0626 / ISP 5235) TaxID=455632 RepID=B1VM72_STRGG|nr:hypothetical protein [Streptomyces griseus]BAG20182.1 hypothetical protein SGR_3353 [Streptomyces griseus subsp. griseus NBRC 13350]SEE82657.1 hypothetical protein SAMN04490359_6169 [Streptomyces griseus]SQA25464.1 Uncharacterised protein [Streptomyces griseus]